MNDVSKILGRIDAGDPTASKQLLPLVYDELRRLAAARLANEKPGHSLQATALVHEAYLRLVDVEQPQDWDGRGHFFAAAAEAMRRILIENARRKATARRGGHLVKHSLQEEHAFVAQEDQQLLAVNEALDQLMESQPTVGQLVKLRFFAGLSVDQAAETLHISPRTAKRYWVYARAWLGRQIDQNTNEES